MGADELVLAQLLVLAGLIAGTAKYSFLLRRRVERRLLAEQRAVEDAALRGLVRVFLADPAD